MRLAFLVAIGWALSLVWVYQFAERNTLGAIALKSVKAQDQAIEHHDKAAVAGQAVERRTVRAVTKIDGFFQGLSQEAAHHAQTNPSPADCRLDDIGLRQWTAANQGPKAAATGESDGVAGGAAAAAAESGPGRPAAEPHRDGEAVPPAATAASGPGRVDGEHGDAVK